jgi:hypothetical protein
VKGIQESLRSKKNAETDEERRFEVFPLRGKQTETGQQGLVDLQDCSSYAIGAAQLKVAVTNTSDLRATLQAVVSNPTLRMIRGTMLLTALKKIQL